MRHKRFCCWFGALALVFIGVTQAPESHAVVPSDFVVNYDEGYEVGYPLGYDYGFVLGFDRGTFEGTSDGETQGYDDGWDTAYWPAWETAYDAAKPVGKVVGFAESFPSAAAEGYQWASEIHSILTNPAYGAISFPSVIAATLINRWGDPSGWGRPSGIHSSGNLTLTGGVLMFNWAAHYYDEGYDDGYDEGKTVGDQDGFDEAYPLAFEAAYEPAFDQGSKEGTFQGLIDGGEEGYDAGWTVGLDVGESVGFSAGADLYVAGGQLENLDLAGFVASYASSLAVAESASVPEPTSLCLGFLGLTLAVGQLRNRPKS